MTDENTPAFDQPDPLVDLMVEESMSANIGLITADSTLTAQNFYRKMGFTDSGPQTTHIVNGTPISCIPMKKDISS